MTCWQRHHCGGIDRKGVINIWTTKYIFRIIHFLIFCSNFSKLVGEKLEEIKVFFFDAFKLKRHLFYIILYIIRRGRHLQISVNNFSKKIVI